MRTVATALQGISKLDLDRGHRLPNGVKSVKNAGGGINGISWIEMEDGRKFVLKADSYSDDVKGARAEEAVARLYRDLGFAQPLVKLVNPDDASVELRQLMIMESASKVVPDARGGMASEGRASYDRMNDAARAEAFRLFVANSIMGNSDRHNGNIMHVDTPDGQRLVVIDNGLSMFNAQFGRAFHPDRPDGWTRRGQSPIDYAEGHTGGNPNTVRSLAQLYMDDVGEAQIRNELIDFAEQVRVRAQVVRFREQAESDFVVSRAQLILDNIDKYIENLGKSRG